MREWWYTGETLASARHLVHSAYTMRMDSGGGGGDGGGGWGTQGVQYCYGEPVSGNGGDGDGDDDREARGEFEGFGEDDLDIFNVRGWVYPLGQGETTSQNMASASVWGTDAENSESVAEFLANHAVVEDMSPAAVSAAEERDEEDDVVAGGLLRQQLCRFFKNYSVGGSSIAFRGFADAHGGVTLIGCLPSLGFTSVNSTFNFKLQFGREWGVA